MCTLCCSGSEASFNAFAWQPCRKINARAAFFHAVLMLVWTQASSVTEKETITVPFAPCCLPCQFSSGSTSCHSSCGLCISVATMCSCKIFGIAQKVWRLRKTLTETYEVFVVLASVKSYARSSSSFFFFLCPLFRHHPYFFASFHPLPVFFRLYLCASPFPSLWWI